MNKDLIALSLVVTLFVHTASAMENEDDWYLNYLHKLRNYFKNEYKKSKAVITDLNGLKTKEYVVKSMEKHMQKVNKTNRKLNDSMKLLIESMVNDFMKNVSNELNHENDNEIKQAIKMLSSDNLNKDTFLSLVYKISGVTEEHSPFYSQIGFDSGKYYKEHLLKGTNKSSKPLWKEEINAPWGSSLGLGYAVDRSTMKRYLAGKAVQVGTAAALAYGAYQGFKYGGGYENKEEVYEGIKNITGKTFKNIHRKISELGSRLFTKKEEKAINKNEKKTLNLEVTLQKHNEDLKNIEKNKEEVKNNPNINQDKKNEILTTLENQEAALNANIVKEEEEVKNLSKKIDTIINNADKRNNILYANKEELFKNLEEQTEKEQRLDDKKIKRLRKGWSTMDDMGGSTYEVGRRRRETKNYNEKPLGNPSEKINNSTANADDTRSMLYSDKESLYQNIKKRQKHDNKRIKRLNELSLASEDIAGGTNRLKVLPGLHDRRRIRNERAKKHADVIKNTKPYDSLEEYQENIRQREREEEKKPWYERLFNN